MAIRIKARAGESAEQMMRRFKKMCEKPWLFVRLPEGDYNVVAVDRNKITRVKPFHVGKEGSKQVKVKMLWPKSVVGY